VHSLPSISGAVLHSIAKWHGLNIARIERLPSTGIINAIYALDNALILRVPRNDPVGISDTLTESVAAPVAFAAGVRTPRLVIFDESREILDVPYTIYERVRGETLGAFQDPSGIHHAWTALGRDLALLHTSVISCDDPQGRLDTPQRDDFRDKLEWFASRGIVTSSHARWIGRWLDVLAPAVFRHITPRFLHNDLQANNVMVATTSQGYLAMIDWGDAGWGDPALDLCAIPLRAIPSTMKGYREVRPFDGDDTLEARVLWDQIMNALKQLSCAQRPGTSRAGYLIELLRFVLEERDGRFRQWFLSSV